MLFKVHDRSGKFMQYISFCINTDSIGTDAFNEDCVKKILASKNLETSNIKSVSCNDYSWTSGGLLIHAYTNYGVPSISLIEVPSLQRMKEIEARKKEIAASYQKISTTDIWYTVPSTFNSGTATLTYTYTPSFTISAT